MVRTFIQTREFSRNWDKLGFKDEDLRKLELELLENSDLHPVIKGTGGLRKIRIPFANEGKSAFCTLWRSQMRFRAVALRSITAARF